MKDAMKKSAWALLPLALFLFLALGRIHTLMGQDEISHYFKIGYLLFKQGYSVPQELIVFSPHGYPLLLAAICKICGNATYETMRIVGILSWALCIVFVAWRTKCVAASCILCCMPLVCQAAVLLDIDETVLVPACLGLWYASLRYVRHETKKQWAMLAVATCLSLWCRLTTPFVICVVMLCVYRRVRLLTAYAVGGLLFLLSWYAYCYFTGVQFSGPFEYLVRSFIETSYGSRASGFSRIVQSAIYVCLWGMNPMLLLLFAVDGWRRFKRIYKERQVMELDSAWLCGMAIFGAYLFIGGSLFGFPKYQCPAFPFIAMCCGTCLKREIEEKNYYKAVALCIISTFVVVVFLFEDPLLFLRYDLRCKELPTSEIFGYAGKVALTYMVSLLMALLVARHHVGWRMGLLLTAVAFNFAFAIKQNSASYSTGYIYGERGECSRLAEMLKSRGLDNELLYIPAEVAQYLGETDEKSLTPGAWEDLDAITEAIESEKPAVVAVSSLISKRNVMQGLLKDEEKLQDVLQRNYEPRRDLTLFYWIRKDYQ